MPLKPPRRIKTKRLLLRPPALRDARAIYERYAQDAQVTRYLPWRPHRSLRETKRFLATCIAAWKRGDGRFPWVITLRDTQEVVGMIEVGAESFKLDVGYVLERRQWGQGLMTEALRAVVQWALGQPACYRVSAFCDVDNIASCKVMEKAGLRREGVLRRFIRHSGTGDRPRDCYSYAVVK